MRSEGRGCNAGHLFPCRKKKKEEDRPIPKPVGNLNDGNGRGCGFLTREGRGFCMVRKRRRRHKNG